jgi:hypothetical protein
MPPFLVTARHRLCTTSGLIAPFGGVPRVGDLVSISSQCGYHRVTKYTVKKHFWFHHLSFSALSCAISPPRFLFFESFSRR